MKPGYRAEWCRYTLDFNFEARTSRGAMRNKDTFFIRITDSTGHVGIGEVPLFRGLSSEDSPAFEDLLDSVCTHICNVDWHDMASSINFGIESALFDMQCNGHISPDPSAWELGVNGIPINGLVWMGDKATMKSRIEDKLNQGFRVLKLKIGGIDFDDEIDLLATIRDEFSEASLEIRLDANGAFSPSDALARIDRLAKFHIHSIEQPIRAGQITEMAEICSKAAIPVALDEELIGVRNYDEKVELLDYIKPEYIILKPALCGGFKAAEDYISIIGPGRWWVTSALESNVGLFAIARWLSHFDISMPQGLGTGLLYSNNIASPLEMKDCGLWYNPKLKWQNLDLLQWRR